MKKTINKKGLKNYFLKKKNRLIFLLNKEQTRTEAQKTIENRTSKSRETFVFGEASILKRIKRLKGSSILKVINSV